MAELNLRYYETYNPFEIGIEDISDYGNYPIHTPLFTVKPPDYPKVTAPFQTGGVNIYSYGDLVEICSGECPELPDGNYEIEFSIKPNNKKKIKKNYFRVTTILSQYFRLFIKATNDCNCKANKKAIRELIEIRMLIEGAVSSANMCDVEMANKKYCIAKKKIENYEKECRC